MSASAGHEVRPSVFGLYPLPGSTHSMSDPTFRVFGSAVKRRRIDAVNALIDRDYCLDRIIASTAIKNRFNAINVKSDSCTFCEVKLR